MATAPTPAGPFSLAGADEVVDALRAAKIRADLDPAKVNLPGVWVQIVDFEIDTMSGTFRTDLRLQLLARDKDSRRAVQELVDLAAKVHHVIPVQAARARTVLLPDGNALPGLEVLTNTRNDRPDVTAP